MGESSACLLRSLSQPCGTSGDDKEGDPLRALTTSISFGRFMTESLAWEKWSSFTHNRYLEEVEKFSKPGSVAQKKAYFEAHYRSIAAKKAAALLEQANSAANDSSESNIKDEIHNNSPMDSKLDNSDSQVPIDEMHGKEAPNTWPVSSGNANEGNQNIAGFKSQTVKEGGVEPIIDQLIITESPIQAELSNQRENVVNHSKTMSAKENKSPIEVIDIQGDKASSKKKLANSYSKSSTYSSASNLQAPVKHTIPVQRTKEGNASPNSRKTTREPMDKKRETTKSLHMSINFASRAGEIIKTSSPILQKIGNSRIVRTFVKASKDGSTQQTPIKASVNGVSKHLSVVSQPGNRSLSGSSGACGTKAQSPTVPSPFSFRSEERVAKRKEFFQKLEEKLNAKETEKVQMQEKAENNLKKMRQSLGFKAKPMANFHCQIESPSDHNKKIPPKQSPSPKLRRKPTSSTIQDTKSGHPWRPSVNTDGSKYIAEKNDRATTHCINPLPKKYMCENASPNIQL